jgi:hypothetical protein
VSERSLRQQHDSTPSSIDRVRTGLGGLGALAVRRFCLKIEVTGYESSKQDMASEEPLFDPSLKKRKKKTVAFTEDLLGAEADPTQPAPSTIDNHTTNGVTVDLGPTTQHERIKQSGEGEELKEEEDFKAMFGDLKKKKKKKEIPMGLVCIQRIIQRIIHIHAAGSFIIII